MNEQVRVWIPGRDVNEQTCPKCGAKLVVRVWTPGACACGSEYWWEEVGEGDAFLQWEKHTVIPAGYVIQDGCYNCQHVFVWSDYDAGEDYFCAKAAPERPLCGSHSMNEMFEDDRGRQRKAWHAWAEGRGVEPSGKCPQWKKVFERE